MEHFSYEYFRAQTQQIRRMGSLRDILKMLPLDVRNFDPEWDIARIEAMIDSMTLAERRAAVPIDTRRAARISRGSGVAQYEVEVFVRQFGEVREMMERMDLNLRNRFRGWKWPE